MKVGVQADFSCLEGVVKPIDGIPITVDFETAYSTTFSLSKMTTQEYVLSPHFEIILVSVKLGDAAPQWFSGSHDETAAWLKRFPFEQPGFVTVIQNAIFDGAILEWILDIHPSRYFCTLMAARPIIGPWCRSLSLKSQAQYLEIGEKGTEVETFIGKWRRDFTSQQLEQYAAYCCNDVALTHKLYTTYSPLLPPDEQRLLHLTITKYTRPRLVLDENVLRARLAEVKHQKATALFNAGLLSKDDLMSNEKFAIALQRLGVDPPMKTSPTTGKQTWAFAKDDPDFKDLLEHEDLRVQALVAARLKHKSTQEETRLERLIAVCQTNGLLAAPLLYYGAHTGRFSGLDKLNLQNLPRKSELRRALTAPKGYKLVAGDLSQIEARITAYLADQRDLLAQFARGEDTYSIFATKIFGRPITKADADERFVGKTCILGMGYGVGAEKFGTVMKAAGLGMTEDVCHSIVRTYRSTYANIASLWSRLTNIISLMSYNEGSFAASQNVPVIFFREKLMLPNTMFIHYPGLSLTDTRKDTNTSKPSLSGSYSYISNRGSRKNLWGGALTENIVQALARIILTQAELYLADRGYEAVLSVHDELIYVIDEARADKFALVLEKVLTRPVPWMPGLPVACEVHVGDTYYECK